ncbi:antibiotic biosynthesis monooxygenase family protein [Siccirubricoccus deserti]|uniref:Antibiotic biosynthesis monooxygenase n=1 Tax=Siccirubricoccus deserti TaxID=2013562 RepID=A0A9X0R3L2_9PROT|nr:antibiotic biosynthesis monooxygenase family protein [Siccirubricoccus deserti]MBC4019109.1 antibiotic biosynthesis monooxygenase [Siccirubricoccus deserti]
MYVVIRRTGLTGSPEEAARRARAHIVPLLRGRPGFRGYCAFVTEQGDSAYSVSIFDDKGTAMDAHRCVRQWVDANMRDLMPDEPEVVGGETVFDSIAHPQEQKDPQQALFVVIRSYRGLPGQTEAMHSVVSQYTLPAITNAPGFRGFYAFRDEADPDRAISITLFDTHEEAMRAHEQVVGIMRKRLGEMAYQPPRTVMGETVVLATV